MRKSRGERVNGVLLLDKPGGVTSNFALQAARRLLNAAKAGHTGTLDPMATGLLPLTFGEATKFSADLLEADKSYRATLTLGVTTSTGDADGDVLETRAVNVSRAEADIALSRFVGTIKQVPPMHSALKRDGRPLYELARAGEKVERIARLITVHRLALVEHRDDLARILECVEDLPDDRREALIMRFALGMDNREIARALGRTDGATKVLLHRAIRQLEELVKKAEGPVNVGD